MRMPGLAPSSPAFQEPSVLVSWVAKLVVGKGDGGFAKVPHIPVTVLGKPVDGVLESNTGRANTFVDLVRHLPARKAVDGRRTFHRDHNRLKIPFRIFTLIGKCLILH